MALILDIETIGQDYDSLDEATQHSLTRWIKREAGQDADKYQALLQDMKDGLGFSPLTGEIVALGILDTVKNKGVVFYQSPKKEIKDYQEASFSFKARSEEAMLKSFWQGVMSYKEVVTFNGRAFDIPFIMMRSAIKGIKPSVNLMANRYLNNQFGIKHIDLLDQLSFYGAMRRKGNLHLYCQAFGIKSPKAEGITGDDVASLFKDKAYQEIAEYNSWDLVATWELYEKWREYLSFS